MRAVFLACLLIAAALAGCATKDSDDGDGSGTTSTSRSGTSGGTGNGIGPNRAPTASLLASAQAGAAPFNVTFTANGTDADGDDVTWVLSFGDASANATGASLPANVTHDYTVAGTFNATLTVSDGRNATAVSLLLNVTAGSSFEQFVAEGTPELSCTQCSEAGANTGVGYRAGVNELDSYFVELPPGAPGQPFTVASTGGDPDVSFRDSCASDGAAVEAFNADGPESGVVPDGAVCALMWEYAGPGSTITLTVG